MLIKFILVTGANFENTVISVSAGKIEIPQLGSTRLSSEAFQLGSAQLRKFQLGSAQIRKFQLELIIKLQIHMFKMKGQMYFISENVKSDLHYPKCGLVSNLWVNFLPQSVSSELSPQSSYILSQRKIIGTHFPLKHRNSPPGQPVRKNLKINKKGDPPRAHWTY